MVYRLAGVYKSRIDEIRPFLPGATVVEEPDQIVLRLSNTVPDVANADVRAMPAGFYVHWWSTHESFDRYLAASDPRLAAIEEQEVRNLLFSNIERWTSDMHERDVYVDFGRKNGLLTTGRYRLVPFSASPALAVELILDGLDQIARYRERIESTVRTQALAHAAQRAA